MLTPSSARAAPRQRETTAPAFPPEHCSFSRFQASTYPTRILLIHLRGGFLNYPVALQFNKIVNFPGTSTKWDWRGPKDFPVSACPGMKRFFLIFLGLRERIQIAGQKLETGKPRSETKRIAGGWHQGLWVAALLGPEVKWAISFELDHTLFRIMLFKWLLLSFVIIIHLHQCNDGWWKWSWEHWMSPKCLPNS